MQELVLPHSVDRMRAVEDFEFGSVADAEFVVVPLNTGELPPDPLIGCDPAIVPTLGGVDQTSLGMSG